MEVFFSLCASPFSCATLLPLSVLHSLHVCLFVPGVCPHVHLYPCLCLHMALCLACGLFLYLPLCPALRCNVLCFPPHCSASPPGQGSLEQELAGSLRHSLGRRERKANSGVHKHRKCCLPHAGSSWVSVTLCGLTESGNVSSVSNRTCLFLSFGLLHLA